MTIIKNTYDKKTKLKNGTVKTKKALRYRFTVTYKSSTGESKRYDSKWYDDKDECLQAELNYKNQENHDPGVSIGVLGHACINAKEGRVTHDTYIEQLHIFDTWFAPIHDIPADKVKPHQIKQCFEPYSHLSTSRKNKGYDILHNLFEYGITYYGLVSNPMDRIPRFEKTDEECLRQMHVWTIDQFYQFYNALPDNLKMKALFHLLFFTGLRRNEALSLTWHEFNGHSLNVWRQWVDDQWSTLKTKNSARVITLDNDTISLLYQLKAEQMENEYFSEDWFIFYGIKQVGTTTIDWYKNQAIKVAGLPHIRLHDFRHSHASYLINSGIDMYAVSRRLGHSSIQMTIDRYTHLLPQENNPIVTLMNNRKKG